MFENRLEGLREENNLKSKDVAKTLNVAYSTYSEWEHNRIPIPTKRLIQIADYYNINIDYLLKLTNKKLFINNTELNLTETGKRLKEVRNNLGLNIRELGTLLNYSFSSLASYERGEKLINCEPLITLCIKSNVSIDYILGRINTK
ncbi:MAG: helix-turn-helix transcriptional regulator [Bacilli bacterium]|nr:helix-turn-helix transcriptional regulator [Bacilli bacterium]